MYNFDYEHLKQTIIKATEQAFAHVKKVTEGESLYAFGLYTTSDGWGYICPTANTEEGLLQKYTEYIQRGHNTYMNDLRWGPCDWIYHLEQYFGHFFRCDRRMGVSDFEGPSPSDCILP